MNDRKTTLKFFSIPGYRKEEQYLSEMHARGWELSHITFPGFYHFTRCTPEEVKYQLDFNQEGTAHHAQYVQMFRDCGWEYLMDYVGFSYFRKPVRDMQGDEDIFCDDESRLDLMKRIFRGRMIPLVVIFFCTILPQLFMNTLGYGVGGTAQTVFANLFFVLFWIYTVIFVIYGVSYYQYEQRVRGGGAGLRSKYIGILAVLVVLAALVCGAMYTSLSRRSDYSLLELADGYSIGMNRLNDTISTTYDLKKGDVIRIEAVVIHGRTRVVVRNPQKESVFDEDLNNIREINIEIEEDGSYQIRCTGKQAEGSISFTVQDSVFE